MINSKYNNIKTQIIYFNIIKLFKLKTLFPHYNFHAKYISHEHIHKLL